MTLHPPSAPPPIVRVVHAPAHDDDGRRSSRVMVMRVDPHARAEHLIGEYPRALDAAAWLRQHRYQHVPASNGVWFRKPSDRDPQPLANAIKGQPDNDPD